MLPNCRGYKIPVWTFVLLCWEIAGWEPCYGGEGEGKPGEKQVCNFLQLGMDRGGGSWSKKLPTVHFMFLGIYSELVNTAVSGDYRVTRMCLAKTRKRERELHRESFPTAILLSVDIAGHFEICQHPKLRETHPVM